MSKELQWRRKWHPDLKACPWKTLEAGGKTFLIKTNFLNNCCEIMITDLVSFWYENLHEAALKKRIEELNPRLEAPLTTILDHIKITVEQPARGTTLSTECTTEEEHRKGNEQMFNLNIKSQLAGLPFTWNFNCRHVTHLMVSDHMTKPLLTMTAELLRQQDELTKIIVLKDKEIDDYISQGARPSRKHYKTVPFDDIAFQNSMLDSKDFEAQVRRLGDVAFDDSSRELYRQIMTKHAWVNKSPTKDKLPQSLDDDESLNAGANTGPSIPSWSNRIPPSVISPESSPTKSPSKSPSKSPASAGSRTPDDSPLKNAELKRRQSLERRLGEDAKKQTKKKKKKLAF